MIKRFVFLLTVVAPLSGCIAVAAGVIGGASGGAVAASRQEGYSAGVYAGTIVSNVFYFPAKVLFAGGGAVTSGIAYVVTGGDREASGSIWDSSTGGDYVLTPSMIAGKEAVHFAG